MKHIQQKPAFKKQIHGSVTDYSLIIVGAFLQALSYVVFLAPYKIVPGGVYGISIVIHHVTKGVFSFFRTAYLWTQQHYALIFHSCSWP